MTPTHVVGSGPLPHLLAVPDGPPPPSGLWPLLLFLHGHDEGPPTPLGEGLTRHGPLREGSASAGSGRFLVVAPQMPARGDLWARHTDAILETVSHTQALHAGDPSRTYLTGFSFGGNGVFDVAIAAPDPWAALWAVDPTRVPASDPHLPIWLSSGELSRRVADGFMRRLRLEPLGAEHAPGNGPTITDDARVIVDAGEDHVGTATRAYHDSRIYDWLLSKSRS